MIRLCVLHLYYIPYNIKKNENIYKFRKVYRIIEAQDPELRGFFNILYQSANPTEKNKATQQNLRTKVMFICYQISRIKAFLCQDAVHLQVELTRLPEWV
ncbi:unnamed protein product [Rhizophagus irregularis]|nr:unnamed protein product [Rhizophagus irregularis]